MRLLIKEIKDCRDCPYLRTKPNPYGCVHPKSRHTLDNEKVDAYVVDPSCPLQKTKGSSRRIIMEEINACHQCPYYDGWARHCILDDCPLEDVLPASEKG